MTRIALLSALCLVLSSCRTGLAPVEQINERAPSHAMSLGVNLAPRDDEGDAALHATPVVSRLEVTPTGAGISFSLSLKHRFPGDHPDYSPFIVGGFGIIVDIDPTPPFNVSDWSDPRIWVLPAEGGLRLLETSLYGAQERGMIAVDVRPHRVAFFVPYDALRDDDGLVNFRVQVVAVTGIGPSGPVWQVTDSYLGDTIPDV